MNFAGWQISVDLNILTHIRPRLRPRLPPPRVRKSLTRPAVRDLRILIHFPSGAQRKRCVLWKRINCNVPVCGIWNGLIELIGLPVLSKCSYFFCHTSIYIKVKCVLAEIVKGWWLMRKWYTIPFRWSQNTEKYYVAIVGPVNKTFEPPKTNVPPVVRNGGHGPNLTVGGHGGLHFYYYFNDKLYH